MIQTIAGVKVKKLKKHYPKNGSDKSLLKKINFTGISFPSVKFKLKTINEQSTDNILIFSDSKTN
jgi:hypothetical protein